MECTCIICPMSCQMKVEEIEGKLIVTGNNCPRGKEHAINEYTSPKRMLTTTISISGGLLSRLPVISNHEIPKEKIFDCLIELYNINVTAPFYEGDVIIHNICGTDTDIVAARTMNKIKL